jgi:hypothetical protein
LVEVKSKRGVPLPILISLERPQFAELYISSDAVSTGLSIFTIYWFVPTTSNVIGDPLYLKVNGPVLP